MLPPQAADERAVFAVGNGGDGAGVDDDRVAAFVALAEGVTQRGELLLHRLRFILVDLAPQSVTRKFHKFSPKFPRGRAEILNKKRIENLYISPVYYA